MLLFDMSSTLQPEEIAGVAGGVAAALADLHRAGRAHGSVDARHVVVEGGAVGLVPPGPACPPATPATTVVAAAPAVTPADDVRALGLLVGELLEAARRPAAAVPHRSLPLRARVRSLIAQARRPGPGLLALPPVEQVLARIASTASVEDDARCPTAASIAALVAFQVPAARPPGRRPPPLETSSVEAAAGSPVDRHRPAPRSATRGALAVLPSVAVAMSAWWLATVLRHRSDRPGDHRQAAAPRVPPLGRPGDVVLTDDWLCRGSPVPALLHPATGEVFVFDHPPGADRPRRVGTVPGATGLRAIPTDDGCPLLAAVAPNRTPVTLAVGTP
jgi:hypothetical protein